MLDTVDDLKRAYRRFVASYIRTPLTVITLIAGFFFEFLVCLPFFVIVHIDGWVRRKT